MLPIRLGNTNPPHTRSGGPVLLRHAVQSDLLRSVMLVVNRGAIRRPVGLPTDCFQ